MDSSVDSDCKLLLYAMTALFFPHKDPNVVAQKLCCILDSCNKWLVDNKLSLHLGKTEYVLFGSKSKLRNLQIFHFNVLVIQFQPKSLSNIVGLRLTNMCQGRKLPNVFSTKLLPG